MKYKVYVVHDSKADAFMMPFFMQEDAQAVRGFQDQVNNPESPFFNHAEDYTLFNIGRYSEETGTLEGVDKFALANGVEVKKSEPNVNQLVLELVDELRKVT